MVRVFSILFIALFFSSCAYYDELLTSLEQDLKQNQTLKAKQTKKAPNWTTLFVVDISGSMNEKIGNGYTRLDSAKEVVTSIVENISTDRTRLGLFTFGRQCEVFTMDNNYLADKRLFNNTVLSLNAGGYTPLEKAIVSAADVVHKLGKNTNVIILSDGEESCGGDPIKGLAYFVELNPNIEINVYTIGYGVNAIAQKQLQNLAYGKGKYAYAANQDELVRIFEIITNELMINEYYRFTVHFDSGKHVVKKGFEKSIVDFAKYAKANNSNVILQGHSDSTGNSKSNMILSEKRANYVKSRLIKLGIKPARIQIQGFGDTKPTDSNNTDEGRFNNRRVDMIAIDSKN